MFKMSAFRLQRRHRLTDDASTRRWRGSQQTGSVRTTRYGTHINRLM